MDRCHGHCRGGSGAVGEPNGYRRPGDGAGDPDPLAFSAVRRRPSFRLAADRGRRDRRGRCPLHSASVRGLAAWDIFAVVEVDSSGGGRPAYLRRSNDGLVRTRLGKLPGISGPPRRRYRHLSGGQLVEGPYPGRIPLAQCRHRSRLRRRGAGSRAGDPLAGRDSPWSEAGGISHWFRLCFVRCPDRGDLVHVAGQPCVPGDRRRRLGPRGQAGGFRRGTIRPGRSGVGRMRGSPDHGHRRPVGR